MYKQFRSILKITVVEIFIQNSIAMSLQVWNSMIFQDAKMYLFIVNLVIERIFHISCSPVMSWYDS